MRPWAAALPAGIMSAEQAADMAGVDRAAAANTAAVRLVQLPGRGLHSSTFQLNLSRF